MKAEIGNRIKYESLRGVRAGTVIDVLPGGYYLVLTTINGRELSENVHESFILVVREVSMVISAPRKPRTKSLYKKGMTLSDSVGLRTMEVTTHSGTYIHCNCEDFPCCGHDARMY